MRRSKAKQSGIGFYLMIFIVLFLMPLVLIMLKSSIYQNKNALRDRNIKTSREMAESIGVDYMNSFATDCQRDAFDELYMVHNTPSFAGLGSATSNLTVARSSGIIRIETVATYDKGGAIPPASRVKKGVDALFTFSSDALKFDLVWPKSAIIGNTGTIASSIGRLKPLTNTVFVNGNFDSGVYSGILEGLWVVKGRFILRSPATVGNALVHCDTDYYEPGSTVLPTATIRTFLTPNRMVPVLDVIPPQSDAAVGSLEYYRIHSSTQFFIPGNTNLRLQLNGDDTYVLTPLNTSFVPTGFPSPAHPFFPVFTVSTAPFTMAFKKVPPAGSGGGIEIVGSSISRPITVAVIGGADVRVTGSITYGAGFPLATASRSFGLLTEGKLIFRLSGAGAYAFQGFYGTSNGTILINKVILSDDPSLSIRGTLYGLISSYTLETGANKLFVRADPNLALFPPPLFPRRPRLIMWDYVP